MSRAPVIAEVIVDLRGHRPALQPIVVIGQLLPRVIVREHLVS
jgi:hypothetical protein